MFTFQIYVIDLDDCLKKILNFITDNMSQIKEWQHFCNQT